MKIVKANKNQLTELIELQKQYMEHHKEIDDYFAFRKEMSDIWKKYITQVLQFCRKKSQKRGLSQEN